ncbi:MAG: hypothetical protein OXE99_09925 [Cellvibrionales bacterium]|nr:hypothetical protein [Cellvibrionales bacterium]
MITIIKNKSFLNIILIFISLAAVGGELSTPTPKNIIEHTVAHHPVMPIEKNCGNENYEDAAELFAWRLFSYVNAPMAHNKVIDSKSIQRVSEYDFWVEAPKWFPYIRNLAPRWGTYLHQGNLHHAKPPFVINLANWQCDLNCLSTKVPAHANDPNADEGHENVKLLDRYGNPVRYEQRFNEAWMHSTINVEAEMARNAVGKLFHVGACQKRSLAIPSVMMKLAWRELQPHEDDKRYITMSLCKEEASDGKACEGESVMLGLVGMHLAAKINKHWEWIWATFEHVNNFDSYVNNEKIVESGFVQNTSHDDAVFIVDKIPELQPYQPNEKAARMNRLLQSKFTEMESRLAYYRLLGVQHKDSSPSTGPDLDPIKKACMADDSIYPYYVSLDQQYLVSSQQKRCESTYKIVNDSLFNPVFEPFPPADISKNKSCIGCHSRTTYQLFGHDFAGEKGGEKVFSDFTFALNNFLNKHNNKKGTPHE